MTELAPLAPNAWLRWDVVRRELAGAGGSLLEIGCGGGAFGTRIARGFTYTAVEPDPVAHGVAASRIGREAGRVLLGDVSVLEPDEQFDVVCAFEVLEHIEDDDAALDEWIARLRPGGLLLLSMPADSSRLGAWDAAVGHFRRYDADTLRAQLLDHGLVDPRTTYYGMPLGYVTENVRNRIAGTGRIAGEDAPVAERTARSNRLLQPGDRVTGLAVQAGTWPFRVVQRAFQQRGTGLVASARAPR